MGLITGSFGPFLWGMELHDLPKFAPQGYLFLLSWSPRYADLSSYRSRRQLEVWVASRLIETLLGDNHFFGAWEFSPGRHVYKGDLPSLVHFPSHTWSILNLSYPGGFSSGKETRNYPWPSVCYICAVVGFLSSTLSPFAPELKGNSSLIWERTNPWPRRETNIWFRHNRRSRSEKKKKKGTNRGPPLSVLRSGARMHLPIPKYRHSLLILRQD